MTGLIGNTTGSEEIGVLGDSEQFEGVRGVSRASIHGGVVGLNDNQNDPNPGPGVYGCSRGKGVNGYSDQGTGVYGLSSTGTGVHGETDKGTGVIGESRDWRGVQGKSVKDAGVYGESDEGAGVTGTSEKWIGIYGESQEAEGVRGVGHKGAGVTGTSEKWIGVYGESQEAEGVRGVGHKGAGVTGTSEKWIGVYGETNSTIGGVGVFGKSEVAEGVRGETNSTVVAAVVGHSRNPSRNPEGVSCGVFGRSEAGEGVHGETNSDIFAAVAGIQLNANSIGAGIYGEHRGSGPAGFFKGDVLVTGDIKLINADCAEYFDVADLKKVEPGTVMVIDEEGALRQSQHAYDKRVAGVISGAGDYKPGLILDKQESKNNRAPLALLGKVYCKVDAQYGAIEVGDLLTTSPTSGHAMKATDPFKAFGAIIGKALRPLKEGRSLIPILIALQ